MKRRKAKRCSRARNLSWVFGVDGILFFMTVKSGFSGDFSNEKHDINSSAYEVRLPLANEADKFMLTLFYLLEFLMVYVADSFQKEGVRTFHDWLDKLTDEEL